VHSGVWWCSGHGRRGAGSERLELELEPALQRAELTQRSVAGGEDAGVDAACDGWVDGDGCEHVDAGDVDDVPGVQGTAALGHQDHSVEGAAAGQELPEGEVARAPQYTDASLPWFALALRDRLQPTLVDDDAFLGPVGPLGDGQRAAVGCDDLAP